MNFPVFAAKASESFKTVSIFFFCATSCGLEPVRRCLSAQFVLQVRGEAARGQMAALTIQRTDNFLHTFLQVC